MSGEIILDGEQLKPETVEQVARHGKQVEMAEEALDRVRESRERVEEIIESGETVYGINTGFGEMANTRVQGDRLEELQHNLIRSHAAGMGRELEREEIRAMLVCRLNSLLKGYSGVRERTVELLAAMLNRGVHPVVKAKGSLGASGDLCPLAHATLAMIGEGEAVYEGDRLEGGEALERAGLEPLNLAAKEGLALINGTSLTVGLAALTVTDAERALTTADIATGLTTEVTMSTTAACDPKLQEVRPHDGQSISAANIRHLTAESEIIESHKDCDRVQDSYSIRCFPQVHGAVRDAVRHLRDAVEVELNSATDNPLIFDNEAVDDRARGTENAAALSGGNFHGAHLALRLDYVTNALTELAAISERRIDRMLNPNLQEEHLPPFLASEEGLNSGYMIAQYTAASLINENRATSRASMDNIPVSGGQEDHVSMSAQSVYDARKAVQNAVRVVGIELLCGCQAAEHIDDSLAHGIGTGAAYRAVRKRIPPLTEDRPLHEEMEDISRLVRRGVIASAVGERLAEYGYELQD
ncbi:MAG: histidine ammonia-lyase [Candidatus Nanohaloarchaea archaeon]|nr:histidine ammonia-lyase [Candidatus Nanohaloarchaea archaeon]